MTNNKSTLAAYLLVGLLVACSGSPTKESTGEYIDDSAITTKVKAAFVEDKVVKATEVKVDTFKGNVQLSGFADNKAEIERAVRIAGQVPGVKTVRNDIIVKHAAQ
jgi:osmotically-inducible protein OsmY